MKFSSTRGKSSPVSVSDAMLTGLAPDGGLYLPLDTSQDAFPGALQNSSKLRLVSVSVGSADYSETPTLAELAPTVLAPFFAADPLAPDLASICAQAFNFPVPLRTLPRDTAVLELFHGPTAAFKDFGARFLAECFSRLPMAVGSERTILVATSGDTGGAVAAAFHRKPGFRLKILFPGNGVSPRQRRQLTCWDDNVESFAVRGSFDDCQRLVKAAFGDESLRARHGLTSANSINIGRLLPQMTYYARAALEYERRTSVAPSFVIPSGNLGNAVGALLAKRAGYPIRRVVLATNANRVVPEFLTGEGSWRPQASVRTLANAMDVGDPSNMERVLALYPDPLELRRELSAVSVSDDEIRAAIARGEREWGEVWCPHTATALHVRELQPDPHWVIVATAHPAKFEEIVEPLLGHPVAIPAALESLLELPDRSREIDPKLESIFP